MTNEETNPESQGLPPELGGILAGIFGHNHKVRAVDLVHGNNNWAWIENKPENGKPDPDPYIIVEPQNTQGIEAPVVIGGFKEAANIAAIIDIMVVERFGDVAWRAQLDQAKEMAKRANAARIADCRECLLAKDEIIDGQRPHAQTEIENTVLAEQVGRSHVINKYLRDWHNNNHPADDEEATD